MRNTQIQQVSNRRGRYGRRRGSTGCIALILGAFVIIGVLVVLLIPALPGIGLRAAGFQPAGRTEDILASEAAAQAFMSGGGSANTADSSAPSLNFTQNMAGAQPPSVFANAGQLGTFTFTPDEAAMALSTGANGQPSLAIQMDETQALDICARRSSVCAGGNDRVRNVTVDFQPGGAIIYADVKVPSTGIWQRGGGVIHYNNATKQFEVLGVDMDGTLYRVPQEVFGMSLDELVSEVNRVLNGVTLTASGTSFRLSEVHMADGELLLILR